MAEKPFWKRKEYFEDWLKDRRASKEEKPWRPGDVRSSSLDLNSPLADWITLFQKVNADCRRDGEEVVPFSDVEFYANQIHNLTEEVDFVRAEQIAKAISILNPSSLP